MAAFCTCCGAEITLKAEACPACGTPRHGMLPDRQLPGLNVSNDPPNDKEIDHKQRTGRL